MTEYTNKNLRIIAALIIGAAYGLFLRVMFEWQELHDFFQIVSTAFLIICPFSVGSIAVLWSAGKEKISVGQQVVLSTIAMLLFMVTMFISLLEGLICIVLVAPVFIAASIVGGLIAGFIHNNFRINKSTLPVFALLPILVAPIEGLTPPERSEQSVTDTIYIAAAPEKVFEKLADVRNIDPDELGFAFVHLIGLPKPVEAQMSGSGKNSIRTSRWEKNVWFQEIITEWSPPSAMHYKFSIPKGAIPKEALDRHVEMGGEYFDLIDGGYNLIPAENGGTYLSLTTRFVNKSKLKLYGNIWGKMVLKDFHHSILGLMKVRSENLSF
jgi:hypothetical protein